MGTATYALEFFQSAPPLNAIYVPVGLGSSICGVAAARNALGLKTEIIAVVAAESPSYARSFAAHRVLEAPSHTASPMGSPAASPTRAPWKPSGTT